MQLLVFDIDGTLVDSQALILAAQREAFEACGWPVPTRERSLSIVGLSLHEAFTALVGPDGPVADLAEAYRRAFAGLREDPAQSEPLFPGVADTILALSRRDDVVLGIATGKSRRGVSHLVERQGWGAVFATIQTADDAPSKPHPAMLLQAMVETGHEPHRSTMIGDTTFDVTMAKAAGIASVGVTWGYHPVQALIEAGAGTIIEAMADLPGVLGLDAPGRRAGGG